MPKKLLAFITLFFIPSVSMADVVCLPGQSFINSSCGNNSKSDLISDLIGYGNSTFIKDFSSMSVGTGGSLTADYSVGSGTGTFTATRGASNPATYVDASGVIQTTTSSNVPRITSGFYDNTGFVARKGILIESSSANLVPKSYTMNDASWTATNLTAVDGGSGDPAGGSNVATLTATAGNGDIQLTAAVTAQTYSVFLKRKTGTGNIQITADSGATWTTVTLTSSWTRHQVSATSASQKCGIRIVTSGDEVYAWGNQFEDKAWATSPILTSSVALTRNVESLTYAIASNRTAATESLFFKHTPLWGGAAVPLSIMSLTDTDTASRQINYNSSSPYLRGQPTSGGATASSTTIPTRFASRVVAYVCKETGDPNGALYLNGSTHGTNTNTDFAAPGWGTNFYVGRNVTGGRESNCIIQMVAFYSDEKSSGSVSSITSTMNS